MISERENMELVWAHELPEWVPMVNKDAIYVQTLEPYDRPMFETGKDWFGMTWELDSAHPELATHAQKPMFDDVSQWKEFIQFPDVTTADWDAIVAQSAEALKQRDSKMVWTGSGTGAFERLTAMMGFNNALLAGYQDLDALKEYVSAFADYRISQIECMKRYINPDFVQVHDDWGNQNNTFYAPDFWRDVFKEPERRIAQAAHDMGMHYMHHSCGYNEPLIADFVEIGIDSWHSVSPENNLPKLKREFGDRLVFAGGISAQVIDKVDVTEEQVRAEVRRAIDVLGPGGGYLCQSNAMMAMQPWVEEVMIDEGTKYGRYDRKALEVVA